MSILPGFFLVNKPSGPTSHDIVDQLRRLTGEKTIGHAGTLDPFATGLLILGIGKEATRRMLALTHLDKWYEAEIELGVETDTYDRTGTIVSELGIKNYELGALSEIIKNFMGPQEQVPPMFSAKKIAGKKLYELARQGKEVERPTAKVNIYRMEIINPPPQSSPFAEEEGNPPQALQATGPARAGSRLGGDYKLHVIIRVSSGTYIRSLAHDLGEKLGCGAHVKELRRLTVGPFSLERASDIGQLRPQADNWQEKLLPIPEVLEILNAYKLNPMNVIASHDLCRGVAISGPALPVGRDCHACLAADRSPRLSRTPRNDDNGLHATCSMLQKKKLLAFGTFDPLHDGHHFFLTEAKKYGDHLTVIVTRNEHLKHFKNREPRQKESERLATVRALPCVDEARLSDENLNWDCLTETKPDLIIVGHDQHDLKQALTKKTALPLIQLRKLIL